MVINMRLLILLFCLLTFACSNDDTGPAPLEDSLYFPPNAANDWESVSPRDLGWNESALSTLDRFVEDTDTRALLILKGGKIVYEKYTGLNLNGNADFTRDSYWYWASAGKTLTSFLVGRAEALELLTLEAPSRTYLGSGWSSLNATQEDYITVNHHLTMTTGLDYTVPDPDCTNTDCLQFLNAPGDRWYYHNAPYTLLDGILEGATNQTFDDFFHSQLMEPVGMQGFWGYLGFNHVFFSTPRDMARFGLLMLAQGQWNGTEVLDNETYYQQMIQTSQPLNPSYGYLWWLNGKSAFIPPGTTSSFSSDITPDAPEDMFAAMGRNGQLLNIVPSQELVVVRMGDTTDVTLVPFALQNQLWEILATLIGI